MMQSLSVLFGTMDTMDEICKGESDEEEKLRKSGDAVDWLNI